VVEKSGRFLLARPPKNRPLISTPASGVLGTVLSVGLKSAYVLIYRKRNVAERRGFDLDLVRVFRLFEYTSPLELARSESRSSG
jgi:hypothetical protein